MTALRRPPRYRHGGGLRLCGERLGERRAATTLNDGTALTARPFHLKIGVISAGLDWWRSATTRVPEGKHFNFLTADPVVKIVVNSRQMDALHAPRLGVQCGGTNSRLRDQKRKSLRQLFV